MIPIQQFMSGALAGMLRKAPLSPEKVAFAWRAAVGVAMDNATRVELHGNVLRVRATNPSWRREIERSAGLIRSRLAVLLGDEIVRELNVRVGQVSVGDPSRGATT